MRRSTIKNLLTALCTLLSACVVHAAPTTQRAIDNNTVEVVSKTVGAHFRVPRTWTPLKNEKGVDPTLLFIYDTTSIANGKPARSGSVTVPRQFHVFLGQPLKQGATLDDAVETARSGLQKLIKDLKFVHDEATTVGDEPAWVLAWNEKVNQHIVETRDGKSTPYDRQIEITREKVLWIKDGKLCDIGTLSNPPSLPAMEKFVAQVGKSFTWTEVK